MKFKGSFDDLKTVVKSVGFTIQDSKDMGNQKQIRTEQGAIVNLYTSTGTLQFQGKKEPKNKLEYGINQYLGNAPQPATEPDNTSIEGRTDNTTTPESSKVFVVHGHDSTSKEQLELIIHKLGLNPFVLANTGGGGLTIIEALEKEIGPSVSNVRFGIVLLTPDDMGYSHAEGESAIKPRARQNVVLEMGMLISSLGRQNVAILKKGHIEVPSDAQGILYLSYNEHVKETVPKLVDRLRSSGFILNPECISNACS
jgi:predicted nucleotide-binding protein